MPDGGLIDMQAPRWPTQPPVTATCLNSTVHWRRGQEGSGEAEAAAEAGPAAGRHRRKQRRRRRRGAEGATSASSPSPPDSLQSVMGMRKSEYMLRSRRSRRSREGVVQGAELAGGGASGCVRGCGCCASERDNLPADAEAVPGPQQSEVQAAGGQARQDGRGGGSGGALTSAGRWRTWVCCRAFPHSRPWCLLTAGARSGQEW